MIPGVRFVTNINQSHVRFVSSIHDTQGIWFVLYMNSALYEVCPQRKRYFVYGLSARLGMNDTC